ncbi:MAG: hypothetical protein IPJ77_01575 [Planctomycetes bacterium]|nr:hypothetical protein [Planctomycetota bacterium]
MLERPTDAARPTGSAAVPASNAPGPGAAAEARHDPGVPANLPAIEDVDEAPFVDKYANATPDERRQALDSLVLTYKDAASGRIKNSEQLLKELEVEMQWLERHLDP